MDPARYGEMVCVAEDQSGLQQTLKGEQVLEYERLDCAYSSSPEMIRSDENTLSQTASRELQLIKTFERIESLKKEGRCELPGHSRGAFDGLAKSLIRTLSAGRPGLMGRVGADSGRHPSS